MASWADDVIRRGNILVDHWAYKPYTLVGPPALQLVLDPLAVIFLDNRLYILSRPVVSFVDNWRGDGKLNPFWAQLSLAVSYFV